MINNKDCIFRPNPISETQTKKQELLYSFLGEHDFIDSENNPRLNNESSKVLAKYFKTETSCRYFIKVGTYGKIYNPIGMYSEGTENKFLARIGKNELSFKEVNQKVFDQYLNFLRTKNIAWLNNAEREML
jgi:hypothetical protein